MFRMRSRLQPHERAILDAVADAAPEPVARMLREQVAQIRYVQRIRGSPEVNFYARHRAAGGWNERWLFPNRAEVQVAEATVQIDGAPRAASLYAVNGSVFALTIRPQAAARREARAEVTQVRIPDWRRLFDADGTGTAGALAPPSFGERRSTDESQPSKDWNVFQRRDLYVVSLPEADWVALAQGPKGQTLVGRFAEDREWFCRLEPDEGETTVLRATSFSAALREV